MKQEDKELLIKDLCARLPYGVKAHIKGEFNMSHNVEEIDITNHVIRYFESMHLHEVLIDNIKPYLRSANYGLR